jgi:biopolymer transport protein TolR
MNVGRGSKRRQMAEINVVPYIDVMLVLLVIFMITAPMLNQGVKVDLPKTKADAIAQKDKEPIVVSIDSEGHYFLNIAAKSDQPISKQELFNQIQQTLAKDNTNQRAILVKADQHIDYGSVVQAMALLQQAGAPSVGLVTDEPQVIANATTRATQYSGNAWRVG